MASGRRGHDVSRVAPQRVGGIWQQGSPPPLGIRIRGIPTLSLHQPLLPGQNPSAPSLVQHSPCPALVSSPARLRKRCNV